MTAATQTIALTPALLQANAMLRQSVVLDLSQCGEFLLAYACVDDVYMLRAFALPSCELRAQWPLFSTRRENGGNDDQSRLASGSFSPLAIEMAQSRQLLLLHGVAATEGDARPREGCEHHLTVIPFRGIVPCLPSCFHAETDGTSAMPSCTECSRCATCRARSCGLARHFSFQSFAPHFRLLGGVQTLLPSSDSVRLVFNCGDAVHAASLTLRSLSSAPRQCDNASDQYCAMERSAWLRCALPGLIWVEWCFYFKRLSLVLLSQPL